MRQWQTGWNALIVSIQQEPPRFIEFLMLILALVLLLIWYDLDTHPRLFNSKAISSWPFLVFSLNYLVGASLSILVRENFLPSLSSRRTYRSINRFMAILALFASSCGFVHLSIYF